MKSTIDLFFIVIGLTITMQASTQNLVTMSGSRESDSFAVTTLDAKDRESDSFVVITLDAKDR